MHSGIRIVRKWLELRVMMHFLLQLSVLPLVAAQQSFSTPHWQGLFASGSGVLQSLLPKTNLTFDFCPSDFFSERNYAGNYHTGDLVMRWQTVGQSEWNTFDTSLSRPENPVDSDVTGSLLHSDFSYVDPSISGYLNITRDWKVIGSDLLLQSTVSVPSTGKALVIGSFGFPMEFDSIFFNRTADEVTAKCSLVDPYIGEGAGYVQVTRLTGTGPNLVITPYGQDSMFEGWRFLFENTASPLPYQSTVFEGFYSWEMLTLAYTENEWSSTQPWNPPSSITIQPGQSVTFGLRFTLAQNVYDIEPTVTSVGRPIAIGLPGYVLPVGVNGKLMLQHNASITSITASPSGAINIVKTSVPNTSYAAYTVTAGTNAYGRVRITIVYADGITQTVHYYVTESTQQTAVNFAGFHFTNSFFNNMSDPFHRFGLITFDWMANQQVTQDPRAWICGQADEAGSVYEGLAVKESVHPDQMHIYQLENMVKYSIWGQLQNKDDYSVKRSLFFYQPSAVPGYDYESSINWGGTWAEADSFATWRTYDYVHVSSIYYSLYRAERVSPNILTLQNSTWYLNQAYMTVVSSQNNTAYADAGLMGETLWLRLLEDLIAEGMTSEASNLSSLMKQRQAIWASESDPYGSEMPWDCTGQEGVYAWSRYFNDQATVTKTLNSIRGYMPTVAHWGWNGNARRYWDFLYGGKLARIERMIHHYGSTLNALPLLDNYKYETSPASPAVFYDLRVGYGGNMGPLSNINLAGQTATAFHSWPDTMYWDGYSGDYGPTYNGHILGSVVYLVEHADFGWVAMGGNFISTSPQVVVAPWDTVKRNIYVAALGLAVQFDAGAISNFTYDTSAEILSINLVQSETFPAKTTIMTYQNTLDMGTKLTTSLTASKGGYVVSLPGSVSFAL